VLHIVQLLHLGNDLYRGGEFFVRGPELGFTITGDWKSSQSWGIHHHHLFNNPIRGDPCMHNLECLHEVTDIGGKLPRRISPLSMQGIPLNNKNQLGILNSQT